MKIAILVLAHCNPMQINKLVDCFDAEHFDFFIHVDKKSNIQKDIERKPNVHLIPDEERVRVKWACYSQVEASLLLLKTAFASGQYDYFWLISGQDFPIKNHKEILHFFEEHKGEEFVALWETKNWGLGKDNNFDKRATIYFPEWIRGKSFFQRTCKHIYCSITGGWYKTFKIFRRKNKLGLPFYFGSEWWCFSHECVSWMLNYLKENPNYEKYLRTISVPDECFYQTLFMASPFKEKRQDNLCYLIFRPGESSPVIFDMSHYDDLMKCEKLICRKIVMEHDKELFKKLVELQKE